MVLWDCALLLEGLAAVDDNELFTFTLNSLDDRICVAWRRRFIAREKLFVEGSRSAVFELTQETLLGNSLWQEIYIYFDLVSRVSQSPGQLEKSCNRKLNVSEN